MSEHETRPEDDVGPDHGLSDGLGDGPVQPSRERRRWSQEHSGCLPVLAVLILVIGGGAIAWKVAGIGNPIERVREQLLSEPPADYTGPGRGSVTFEVQPGDTLADMGRNLEEQGVVASVEAFTDAARQNAESTGIQAGFYQLQQRMPAADALEVLVDPANIVTNPVTIPEGYTVEQILDRLAKQTDFKRRAFEKMLDKPGKLGLPEYAGGRAEGYLFPATYPFGPDDKPRDMLRAMVDRWEQAAERVGLEERARQLGYSPDEVMTVASLVQAEVGGEDMPKAARVIYNRLENPDVAGARLQIDAAVNYALGRDVARLTQAQIDSVADSPYNTYTQPGLPPGPIGAPGQTAIEAAANPAEGDWYFYVTVNLATGETKFAETGDEFFRYRAELEQYCDTQSDRC